MRLTNLFLLIAVCLTSVFLYSTSNSVITSVFASEHAVSKDEAAQIASKKTGGQVLSVDTKTADGQTTHFVKVLLSDGHIKILPISARNGAVGK